MHSTPPRRAHPSWIALSACLALWAALALGCAHHPPAAQAPTKPAAGNDVVIGPEYRVDPDLKDQGRPKGRSFELSLRLADSKVFRGDDATLEPWKKPVRTERRIFVYIPASYRDGDAAPVLVIHDGPGPLSLVRNALDNLSGPGARGGRRLPAFIAIAVENG
ncbi:MAG: enterobactin esterase, partial [Verrucomicrobiota bacterium]